MDLLHQSLAVVLANKDEAQVRLLLDADEHVQLVGLGHAREAKGLEDWAGILEVLIVRDQVVVDQLDICKDFYQSELHLPEGITVIFGSFFITATIAFSAMIRP